MLSAQNTDSAFLKLLRQYIVRYWALILIAALSGILLLFFSPSLSSDPVLKQIQASGQIRIVTRNAPTTYYEKHNEQFAGIEYDMAVAFAEHLKVKPVFIVKDTIDAIFQTIVNGKADFAAAGLTITDERLDKYLFGPSYQSVRQEVVCRRYKGMLPKSLAEFDGTKLVVSATTSYAEHLRTVQSAHPHLNWFTHPEWDTELLLRKVWLREIPCTVSDSNIFAINRRYYPELKSAFALTDDKPLAWLMRRDAQRLNSEMFDWFAGFKASGKMAVLLERYYGHLDSFDYVDTRRFKKKITQTLPRYRKWFKEAAKIHGLDWVLLAAQSYQESHWNPRAKSPTGVRGIMMLTLPTAHQLGVKSRLDAKSNIFAGAKYLAQLRKRLPQDIKEPERSWMALAAYNLGYGHLSDARELTRRLGKNPARWLDLEENLLRLSQKRFYSSLKHGYARGEEAVQYVNQIREYREILNRYRGQ